MVKEYRLFWEDNNSQVGFILDLFRAGFQMHYQSIRINPANATEEQLRDLPILFRGEEIIAKGADDIKLYVRRLMEQSGSN